MNSQYLKMSVIDKVTDKLSTLMLITMYISSVIYHTKT